MRRKILFVILCLGMIALPYLTRDKIEAKESKEKGEKASSQISVPADFFGNLEVDPREGWLRLSFRYLATQGDFAPYLELNYDSNSREKGTLGMGWRTQAGMKLIIQDEKKNLVLIRPDRDILNFTSEGKNAYISTTGPLVRIRKESEGYVLTDRENRRYLFSNKGRLLKISDENNQFLQFVYGQSGLVQISDNSGRFIRFRYQKGHLASAEDFSGRKVTFSYNKHNLLSAILDSEGRSHLFEYNKFGRISKINRGAVHFEYNKGGQVLSVEGKSVSNRYYSYMSAEKPDPMVITEVADALGNITYYKYSTDERTISVLDSKGRSTVYYMNGRHLPSMIIQPGHRITRFKYDKNFNLSQMIDPEKRKFQFNYDEENHLVSITKPDNSKMRFSYDDHHNISRIILPDGSKYKFQYNSKGELIALTNPEGLTSHYRYNSWGYVAKKWDNRGNRETYSYDKQGRLNSMTRGDLKVDFIYSENGRKITLKNNLGMSISAKINKRGKLSEYTDPKGRTIKYNYNDLGLLSGIAYPNGAFSSFRYDSVGNLVSLIDPAGRVYAFGYDALNRQTSWVDPAGKVTKYAFNKMDLESAKTLPDGTVIRYQYDKLGRMVKKLSSHGESTFSYDRRGNLASMKNDHGHYEIKYDSLNRPKVFQDKKLGQKLTYTYNERGLRSSMRGSFGTIHYKYDDSGRIRKVTGPKGNAVSYNYNSQGFPSKITYPNGVTTTYNYDALGRLVGLLSVNSDGETVVKRVYTYDKNSNRSQEIDQKGRVTKYTYDQRGQLLKVLTSNEKINYKYDEGGNRVAAKGSKVRYRYDNAGNRIAKKKGKTLSYAYDKSGRLVLKGKTQYLYDPRGNLTAKVSSSKKVKYKYNDFNKLTKVEKKGKTIEFGYAPNGARVWKKNSKGKTRYLYDFEDVVAEFKNGKMVAFYLHGPGIDEPLAMHRKDRSPQYYHTDGMNSVTALTDKSGSVSAKYAYGPFGEIIQEWGFAEENPYRYTGRWYDEETGLYYYRSRYYDPEDGRFTTPDPMLFGGGINLYAYVGNNPVNYSDPWGTKRSLWGFVKDVGSGVGLLMGVGPKNEVKAMRKGFTDSLFSKQTLDNAVAFGRGFGKGVWSGVKGVYNTVRHPIRTGKAIYHAIENFDETKAAIGALVDEYIEAAYSDPEKFAEMTGQLTGELAFAIAGTKGLDKLGKVSYLTKLKGASKLKVLKGTRRMSRFVSRSRMGGVARNTARRMAPTVRALKKGAKKVGGAYVYRAGKKVAPWLGKKIKGVGRGYWKFTKKAAVPTIVAFNDQIENAIKTYKDYDDAARSLNKNVVNSLDKFRKGKVSTSEGEKVISEVDSAFSNYRDYLFKPVHEADEELQARLAKIAEDAESGRIDDSAAEFRVKKYLFKEYPKKRLDALEEVYVKNKAGENYAYIGSNGKVNKPLKNRVESYNHQIEVYKHLAENTNNSKLKESLNSRVANLEKMRDKELQDFYNGEVDVLGGETGDVPGPTTPGAIEKLENLDNSEE